MSTLTEYIAKSKQEPAGCPSAAATAALTPLEDLCGDGGFLVLSREVNEDIVIEVGGEFILIRCVDIRSDKTRIGIKARRTAKVHRREVWDRIREQERAEWEAFHNQEGQ